MADHARDFRLAVRLGKQEHAGIEAAVMENRVFGIARREQYLHSVESFMIWSRADRGPESPARRRSFGRPPRVIARPFAETRQISSNVRLQPFCGGAALRAWAARGQAAAQPRAIMPSRDKASWTLQPGWHYFFRM